MSLLTRTQYFASICEAAKWHKPRVEIVTFGAPHTWPINSPVRTMLYTLGKAQVETSIYVGLPSPDSEVYNDHVERTEGFARVWRLVKWRLVSFSHVKYYLSYSDDELRYGAVGSINITDSRLNDLAVEATGGTLKALARVHNATRRYSRPVASESTPLPPADWADRILQDVDSNDD